MSPVPSQALTKRSADAAMMPPPPRPKRQKRPPKVLDEDVYAEALSHIISRDFFPGLLESQAQENFMDALTSKNNDWIREAGRTLTQVMTPGPEGRRRPGRGTGFTPGRSIALGQTPQGWVGDTPSQTPRTDVDDHFAPEQQPYVDVNMSLSAFQAKYTSEDNESFNALLDKQNEKRAAKYTFFDRGNNIPSARLALQRARDRQLLDQGGSASLALSTRNAVGEERRALAHARPSEDLDVRRASLDNFPNREGPRNHFMFDPESIEEHSTTSAQQAEQNSKAPPKAVSYAATRFVPANAAQENPVPPSPSISTIDAAIVGRPKRTESEADDSGAETPRVNGYAFVDAEPTPSELGIPIPDEEADTAEREVAMKFLPQADDGGPNPFKINDRSKREDLHLRLVEKADQGRRKGGRLEQLRELGVTPARTPTPKFESAPAIKKGVMTPAAKLLAAKLGTPARERKSAFDGPRSAWTPPPRAVSLK